MDDETEPLTVRARLDEMIALLRSIDQRLQRIEARGNAERLGPLVGARSDVGPTSRVLGSPNPPDLTRWNVPDEPQVRRRDREAPEGLS